MLEKMWRHWNSHALLVKIMAFPQKKKIKCRISVQSTNSTPGHITKYTQREREIKQELQQVLDTHVHCSTVLNTQRW